MKKNIIEKPNNFEFRNGYQPMTNQRVGLFIVGPLRAQSMLGLRNVDNGIPKANCGWSEPSFVFGIVLWLHVDPPVVRGIPKYSKCRLSCLIAAYWVYMQFAAFYQVTMASYVNVSIIGLAYNYR